MQQYCLRFLIEREAGNDPVHKSIHYDQEHDKTEPGKKFKIAPYDKVFQVSESLHIDLSYK